MHINDFVTVAMVSCCTTIITSLIDDVINIYKRNFTIVLSDIELGGSRTDHSPHMLLHVPNSTRMLVTSSILALLFQLEMKESRNCCMLSKIKQLIFRIFAAQSLIYNETRNAK